MVLWGAIVGFVLGVLLPSHPTFGLALLGAVMGAVAGVYLRNAVRTEIRKTLEAAATAPAVAKTVAAAPAAASQPAPEAPAGGFAETQPVPAASPPVATPKPLPEPVLLAALRKLSDAAPPVEFSNRQTPAVASADAEAQPPASPPGRGIDLDVAFRRARGWLLGGNTVVRAGVLVLFVGLAFLAKYAVEQALLPPQLRLAAIGAAGIALFAFGFHLHRTRPDRSGYALTLQGAGVAVLYLTVFAAFRLYQFLPAGAAFGALAVICALSAFIAVAQDTQAMAFIGFAGAFAAPLLVSTGQGSHVALFSYYLLLGVAIATLAWAKAWRALNLLGFFATFGIATLWGVLQYRPEQFATTEPFLVAFFLVYLVASLAYATRHSLAARRAVDATLVFGTPIVAFGLQAALVREIEYAAAFSALALGALYLALGWWMWRSARAAGDAEDATVRRWLAESFVALGVGFATLAVPLALDGRWTAAVWAVEGAGVFWMGRRQERVLARAAGLALQVLAGLAFLESDARSLASHWPFANPRFIGSAMLAGAAFAIAYWSREPAPGAVRQGAFALNEHQFAPFLFWVGFAWWQYALVGEIHRAPPDAQGIRVAVLEPLLRLHLTMLGWVGSAFILHRLALPGRARPWSVAATPAWTVVPFMVVMALLEVAVHPGPFRAWGWLGWPLALVLHAVMLRALDGRPPQRWWLWVHASGVWLVVLLGGLALESTIAQAGLWQTAWAAVVMLVAGTLVLLLLSRRAWFAAAREGGPWPLARFGRSYLWRGALPLAVLVALGALAVAVHSDGDARPLPYVPLLNPAELAVALALAACVLWLQRIRGCDLPLPDWSRERHWLLVPAAIGFVALNTVWLRIVHHHAGIAWDARALFDSFLVQAGYSVLWTLLALALMVGANRRGQRSLWMTGAVLLGITVLKLFVIDLSNRGGSERIFVFIAVGLLMLVVGYFAPVPPATRRDPEPVLQEVRT